MLRRKIVALPAENIMAVLELYLIPPDDLFASEFRRDWLDRLDGGNGCWRLAEEDHIK
jgi:hypothetical protein